MRFFLINVNTELSDNDMDLEFPSMEALLEWVKKEEYEWSSLVINVLPAL